MSIKHNIENISSRFIAEAAAKIEDKFKFLVFTSPLSARTPDICMLWHPVYYKKSRIPVIAAYSLKLILSVFKGLRNFYITFNGVYYGIYGKVKGSILILPSLCGTPNDNCGYQTAYVRKNIDDAILVFGPKGECGRNETKYKNSGQNIVSIFISMLYAGFYGFFRAEGNLIDRLVILLFWLEWAASCAWLQSLYLEQLTAEIITKHGLKKVAGVHEMHYYCRAVWNAVERCGVKSYAVQHAEVTYGKKWYFPGIHELSAGIKTPKTFYVYNEAVKKMLEPYYPGTEFRYGCSSRYAKWKNVSLQDAKNGVYYLFVGALAGFDNDILIETLRRIINTKTDSVPVKLRLHRFAIVSKSDRIWMAEMTEQKKIELTGHLPLIEDIKSAKVVIGMSTTVLEEALLLEKPVIQLTSDDYLEYIDLDGVKGCSKIKYVDFNAGDMIKSSVSGVDTKTVREKLGLNYDEVTYSKLFE